MARDFNYHMMTLARESRGHTQSELSILAGIAQGTLSKYETGFSDPPREFVDELAGALDFPASFFYEPGRPYGFPPFHFRKRKKLSAKALGRIVAQMNIRRMHIQKMMVSYDFLPKVSVPELDADDYRKSVKGKQSVEDIARSVREMWMLPRGPIDNFAELLENNGGIVIYCDFGTELLDAMSQRIDGLPILYFVNSDSPADRVRHTLAHELGHMVLHTTTLNDDTTMEEEADAFAGAFLLPADEFKAQMRVFNLPHLANMKQYWKVSMASIAYRAGKLNLITPHQSKMFWMEMGRLGYRKREPNEPAKEEGTLLNRMIQFHTRKLGYSVEDMCKLLCTSKNDYSKMYEVKSGVEALRASIPESHGLRLVK